jgi:MFS family permease
MATVHTPSASLPWYRGISRYQWWILAAAFLGWMFDGMDTTLYLLTLRPMMTDLLGPAATASDVAYYGGIIIAVFLVGWGLGGLLFGVVGDTIGRARTMTLTILLYAVFTGFVALSQSWWHVMAFRFITALGIGGEWAAGSALIAETWPDRGRAMAGGIMMSAYSVGYFVAALINLTVSPFGWRWMYVVGVVPALIAVVIRWTIHEPERWTVVKKRRDDVRRYGARTEADRELAAFPLTQLFRGALRRRTIIASVMCFAATFGFWGTQTWVPMMTARIVAAEGSTNVVRQVSMVAMALNVGSLIGVLAVAWLADAVGRRTAYLVLAAANLIVVPVVFGAARSYNSLLLLIPLYAMVNNGIFAVFVPYFSELYPTNLRTTGAGFCFNAARIVSSSGPYLSGILVGVYGGSFALTAATVAVIYVLGLGVGWLAPETLGQPLPE